MTVFSIPSDSDSMISAQIKHEKQNGTGLDVAKKFIQGFPQRFTLLGAAKLQTPQNPNHDNNQKCSPKNQCACASFFSQSN